MTESPENPEYDVPAQDEGDENPDELVGEPCEPDHDLDVDSFDDEEE